MIIPSPRKIDFNGGITLGDASVECFETVGIGSVIADTPGVRDQRWKFPNLRARSSAGR